MARNHEALLLDVFRGGPSIVKLKFVKNIVDVILHGGDFDP